MKTQLIPPIGPETHHPFDRRIQKFVQRIDRVGCACAGPARVAAGGTNPAYDIFLALAFARD